MTRILSVLNIFMTLGLVILGSITHSASGGLDCPSWPICFGQSLSSVTSFFGVSYAMWHRVLAGFVICINVVLFFRDRSNNYFRTGLLLLITQSILGALSVVYKFPSIMSVAHLFLSIAYIIVFSLSILQFKKIEVITKQAAYVKDLASILIALIFVQIFLGGVINHTSASLDCSDIQNLTYKCSELGNLSWWPQKLSAKIHMLHRYNAVLIFLGALLIWLLSALSKTRAVYKSLFLLMWFIGTQIISAAPMIRSIAQGNSYGPQLFHLLFAIGSLLTLYYVRAKLIFLEQANFKSSLHTIFSDLFELTKPRLGLLVIATIFSGVLISAQMVDFFSLIWAIFLSALIVASATTLNCYMEKDVDALMDRTRDRSLPSGRLPAKYALIQGIILIAIAIPLTAYTVNLSTAILGLIAFVFYLFFYTPMKQKSPFALYVGAIPGAIPPVMGRTIVVGHIDELAWILFAVLFIWQIPHFMAISIYHKNDYQAGGIKVYSHFWSEFKLKMAIFILTIFLVVSSMLPFYSAIFPREYFIASLALGIVFIAVAAIGFMCQKESAYIAWARKYFLASIIYLPLLMAAMIFFS